MSRRYNKYYIYRLIKKHLRTNQNTIVYVTIIQLNTYGTSMCHSTKTFRVSKHSYNIINLGVNAIEFPFSVRYIYLMGFIQYNQFVLISRFKYCTATFNNNYYNSVPNKCITIIWYLSFKA